MVEDARDLPESDKQTKYIIQGGEKHVANHRGGRKGIGNSRRT
jgi:hypothetical protein